MKINAEIRWRETTVAKIRRPSRLSGPEAGGHPNVTLKFREAPQLPFLELEGVRSVASRKAG